MRRSCRRFYGVRNNSHAARRVRLKARLAFALPLHIPPQKRERDSRTPKYKSTPASLARSQPPSPLPQQLRLLKKKRVDGNLSISYVDWRGNRAFVHVETNIEVGTFNVITKKEKKMKRGGPMRAPPLLQKTVVIVLSLALIAGGTPALVAGQTPPSLQTDRAQQTGLPNRTLS